MSFSQLAVRRMKSICPELPTVFLMSHPLPLAYRGGALPGGAGAAGLDLAILRARPEVVARQHDEGHEVFVWTVDEDVDIQRCLELKVDAIITNRPRHVLDVVARNR
ncbi:glycerophosphodiester phosphodiesterase [Lapillicoccus sp.]|uniref:glycerophosphodiester phosphodiesterase n=1 Tax=Lapillicoccus sp. TaxID=1909287 RepID=UPI0039834277